MPRMSNLSHLDGRGRARMVDVGPKPATAREAMAEGFITLTCATLKAIADETIPKGEVLNTLPADQFMAAVRPV